MALFNANLLVRELRKASGLTQEQLAEGICSRQTITAIEKGTRKPDWFIFSNILKKLNVDPSQYYSDIASEDEIFILNSAKAVNKALAELNYDDLKVEINKMEQDDKFSKGLGLSVLISAKSVYPHPFNIKRIEADAQLALEYSTKYIKMFRPDFEIEKIPSYFLSDNDIKAFGRLAAAYGGIEDFETSIKIRYMILENIEKNYAIDVGGNLGFVYIYTLGNLAIYLCSKVERFEECIKLTDKGLSMFKGADSNIVMYFRILLCKAHSLMKLGQTQQGESEYKRCVMFAYAMGETASFDMNFEHLKKSFKDDFGYELNLDL